MDVVAIKDKVITEFDVAESIKTLRTNVIFSGTDVKVIGLTSCFPSDGKTTMSFNLAASLAQSGKRVALIDADLRRSVLMKYAANHPQIVGLGHYLSGMCTLEELLFKTDVPNLLVAFAGARVPNPAELLGSQRMSSLIEALRNQLDYVIIDTPPLGSVIDCAIMRPFIDGYIIVVNAQNNSYKTVRRIKAQLEKANGKILGVVLNKVNYSEQHYYYGKGYGKYGKYAKYGKYGGKYGYYGYYGYGQGDDPNAD